jgi:hypothetical protein
MEQVAQDAKMAVDLEKAKKKKVLISLAPSACQAEAQWNGFHVINLDFSADSGATFEWDRYQFDGAHFTIKQRHEHRA